MRSIGACCLIHSQPLFKPNMWPTGFSLPVFFFLGGGIFLSGFQEDESPMAETGGASFSFKLPDGSIREAGSEPALIQVKTWRGTWVITDAWNQKSPIFHRCWWFRISGFYTIQFVVKKLSPLHLTICGFVWYIAGGHRWISELSTLKSWERSQWNIQLSRFWTLRVLYSLSTERNRILKTNLRWTKCWEFLQITGCSSKHRRGHWNTIHPRYMWFWPPAKTLSSMTFQNTLCVFFRCPICFFFNLVLDPATHGDISSSWKPSLGGFMNFHF